MIFKFRKKDGSIRTMEGKIAKKQPNIDRGQVLVYEQLREGGKFKGNRIRSFKIDRIINE